MLSIKVKKNSIGNISEKCIELIHNELKKQDIDTITSLDVLRIRKKYLSS